MAIDRRTFLTLTAAALALGPFRLLATPVGPRLLSCRTDAAGNDYLTALGTDGRVLFDLPLPGRGHGIAVRPGNRQCVVVARRPGTFLWVVDLESGEVSHRRENSAGRHFFGHGVFSPRGRLFYVTENDFEAARGVIGVYDAADGYRRLGELPSHGIGPHELKLLGDGRTLALANGGIQTHPDLGRSKLNLPDMDPNLAYVDVRDGRLLGTYRPPPALHQLSIRHLDVGPDDQVCIGMQYQGPAHHRPPLVALHRGEESLRLLTAPASVQDRMHNYCGSVCLDPSGRVFAVSSPQGGLVTFWCSRNGAYIASTQVADGCGLAGGSEPGELLISSGQGELFRYRIGDRSRSPLGPSGIASSRWDNHMSGLTRG
jgi:hypothetical protein